MRRLFILLLAAFPSFAQPTIYAPVPGDVKTVTGATNATPMVLTTSAAHGLSVGDTINVVNVCVVGGTSSAANGVRKVKTVPSATTFSITDLSDVDVAGNGNWSACPPIGGGTGSRQAVTKVLPYQMVTGPVGLLDGWNGKLTREFSLGRHNGLNNVTVASGIPTVNVAFDHPRKVGDKVGIFNSGATGLDGTYSVTAVTARTYILSPTSATDGTYSSTGMRVSARAHTGNPLWGLLLDQCKNRSVAGNIYQNATVANWGGHFGALAFAYFIDPSLTTYRDAALWMVDHVENMRMKQNLCNEMYIGCGDFQNTQYVNTANMYVGLGYSILHDEMTSAQRTKFADFWLNDVDNGGCTKHSTKILASGTIQASSTTAITLDSNASSTNDAYVNQYILTQGQNPAYSQIAKVTAYDGTTKIATVTGITYAPIVGKAYQVIPGGSSSGTTITGYGTHFTTELSVGDPIAIGVSPLGSQTGYVASIVSDTQLTFSKADSTSIPTMTSALWYDHAWQTGDCGEHWWVKHHGYHPLGPGTMYPPGAGSDARIGYNNIQLIMMYADISMASALAVDDPRAIKVLQDSLSLYIGMYVPSAMGAVTGINFSGSSYGLYRTAHAPMRLMWSIQNMLPGYPDIDSQGAWYRIPVMWPIYAYLSASTSGDYSEANYWPRLWGWGYSMLGGDQWNGSSIGEYRVMGHAITSTCPTCVESRYAVDFLLNRFKPAHADGTEAGVSRSYALDMMMAWNPNVVPLDHTTQPLQYLFRESSSAACNALGYGSTFCRPDSYQGAWISRTGWKGADDTSLFVQNRANVTATDDHDIPVAHMYQVNKGRDFLLGNDHTVPDQSTEAFMATGNTFQFGDTTAMMTGLFYNKQAFPQILRWSGSAPYGDNLSRYSYGLMDGAETYNKNVNMTPRRTHRHVLHLKDPNYEELVVVYDDVDISNTPNKVRAHTHYVQNGGTGEGTTTCPDSADCSALNTTRQILSQSAKYSLISKFFSPRSDLRVFVESGSQNGVAAQPGGYTTPTGSGYTFRASYCTSSDGSVCSTTATGMEAVVVHKIAPNLTNTTLTATELNPDADWTGVQTADAVVLFARKGVTPSNLAFTSSHSGTARYFLAGLATGTYTVSRDGIPVQSNLTVASKDNTAYFEGTAGNYSVSLSGTPTLSIFPLSLAFSATAGGSNPANKAVSANCSVSTCNATITTDKDWCTVNPANGPTTLNTSVHINVSGLVAGTYTCTVTVTAPEAVNSPQAIPVTLTVAPGTTTLYNTFSGQSTITGDMRNQ